MLFTCPSPQLPGQRESKRQLCDVDSLNKHLQDEKRIALGREKNEPVIYFFPSGDRGSLPIEKLSPSSRPWRELHPLAALRECPWAAERRYDRSGPWALDLGAFCFHWLVAGRGNLKENGGI